MIPRWYAALGFALTGEKVPLPEPGRPDATGLLAALAEAGWSAERIARHAHGVASAERAWPHPVPAELRKGCGAAQLAAALIAARDALGLTVLETRPPSPARALNADERRLMREVPPHHIG